MADPKISIITVTYNNESDIPAFLSAIFEQTYENFEIILVDSASTDKTLEQINKYPTVKIVASPRNIGYGKGTNLGYQISTGDLIAVLNPDTIVDKNWLYELVSALKNNPNVGIVTPKILMHIDQKIINTCGNDVHFTGFGFSRGIYQSDHYFQTPDFLFSPSGCSFVTRREIIEKVAFFDEDFFLRSDVPDFAWRIHLIGYACLFVPSSRVFHKYKFKMNSFWYYVTERGRLLFLFKNYTLKSLVLILIPLITSEILSWGYALLKGKNFILSKILAYSWILGNKEEIHKKRRILSKMRQVDDREIFRLLTWRFDHIDLLVNNVLARSMTKVLNSIFYIFYVILLKSI